MKKILIVDDEEDMRHMLKNVLSTLSEEKPEIFEAENGLEAFQVAEKQKLDLIVTDYKMSLMTGSGLILALRKKLGSSVPVILISGYAEELKKDPDFISDITFLDKPVRPEVLIETVQSVLKKG